ncbi:hypothetical protein VE02_01994 [Pseudogymnoascus sp. 03VT05]|nr:hypothetical protein VE02_01994 [Pseudogymnoascus sp. 03VT05]
MTTPVKHHTGGRILILRMAVLISKGMEYATWMLTTTRIMGTGATCSNRLIFSVSPGTTLERNNMLYMLPTFFAAFGTHPNSQLALLDKVGINLWKYKGPQGQSIQGAVDFILPGATGGAAAWQYPELEFYAYAASDIMHAAADAGNLKALKALSKLQTPPGGDLWALRPAVEQLDAISN